MPSNLLTSVAKSLTGFGGLRRQAKAVADALSQTRQSLSVRGPFTGFTPDVDANLLDGTAFKDLTNCLARSHGADHGEVLGLPDGFRQVDSDNLPLGDGLTLPAAPTTDATTIVRLDQLARYGPSGHATPGELTGEFILTPLAATAGDGSTANTGNLYRIGASATWLHIPPAASMSTGPPARQLSADRDGRTVSQSMPDSCVAPFGATTRDDNNTAAPGTDLQSGPIQEPCWIYTNDVDEVMVFPSSTVSTLAGTHAYEPLCDPTSCPDLDGGGADGFRAKSVETWNGRVYFLNTSEAGTRFSQRLRRTAKFTADPDPTIVGAGFYDFRDFAGEGLRIETLGDVLAVYFSDGVAFLRPTGVPTSPDEPQILSTERGLISTHAVTSIGRNVHFGIFTDGWWMLDQSGRWQEVGLANLENKQVPKWRQTFYDRLSVASRHRLYVYYDQPANLVYVALPTNDNPEPNEVWIYDPTSDRVFQENYPVTCFGTFTPASQAGTAIDDLPGTIESLAGTIDSWGSIPGFPKVRVHGNTTGYVFTHHRDVEGFDSSTSPPVVQSPAWSFTMGLRSPGGMRHLATVDRVSLEYFNHQNNANVAVQVNGPSTDGVQAVSVLLNEGGVEDLNVKDAWFRYTSRSPGLSVSGSGEYHIRGLEMDLFLDPLEKRQ